MNNRVNDIEKILKELVYIMEQFTTYKINLATEQVKILIETVYPPCNDRRLVSKVFSFDDILEWTDEVNNIEEFYLRFRACWDDKEEFKE